MVVSMRMLLDGERQHGCVTVASTRIVHLPAAMGFQGFLLQGNMQ
ncbi:hypothetical protein Leryth_004428, partial [Lithospermum erythrorhizon]